MARSSRGPFGSPAVVLRDLDPANQGSPVPSLLSWTPCTMDGNDWRRSPRSFSDLPVAAVSCLNVDGPSAAAFSVQALSSSPRSSQTYYFRFFVPSSPDPRPAPPALPSKQQPKPQFLASANSDTGQSTTSLVSTKTFTYPSDIALHSSITYRYLTWCSAPRLAHPPKYKRKKSFHQHPTPVRRKWSPS
jgi:hypothetical protein